MDPKSPLTENLSRDLLASIVVFLVALPLCMGIAIASGAPVSAGLITGIIGGLVVGTLSGAPLQVSGTGAGVAVIVYQAIQTHGLEMLGPLVVVAGLMQLGAGALGIGQWFRAVSPAVVFGMLAGIGILIVGSQFHVMLDDRPQGGGLQNLATIPTAIEKAMRPLVLPPSEARERQRELLQSVGEVHRRQIQLTERVREVAPSLPDEKAAGAAPLPPAQAAKLQELAAEQQAIQKDLAGLLEGYDHYYSSPHKRQRIAQRHRNAETALANTITALRSDHPAKLDELSSASLASVERVLASLKNHEVAAAIGVFTILLLIVWKRIVPQRIKLVPGPLIAVLLATAAAAIWTLPVLYVEVPRSLQSEMHFLSLGVIAEAPWGLLLQTAALLAIVASAETLLSATALDQLHEGQRTKYDRELAAQGVGNLLCGMVGALPMTGVIARSSTNVQAGARTRLSTILHGAWLLIFVVAFGTALRMVPTSCLAAILVYTGFKLIDFQAIRRLKEFGWSEVVIYAVTVAVIVVQDLLTGVVVGLILSIAKLVYTFSHLKSRLEPAEEGKRVVLKLDGAATFIRLPQLAAELERVPRGADLHVDLEHLTYIDHACLDLLMNWSRQHQSTGGATTIDWSLLQMTVRNGVRSKASLSRVA